MKYIYWILFTLFLFFSCGKINQEKLINLENTIKAFENNIINLKQFIKFYKSENGDITEIDRAFIKQNSSLNINKILNKEIFNNWKDINQNMLSLSFDLNDKKDLKMTLITLFLDHLYYVLMQTNDHYANNSNVWYKKVMINKLTKDEDLAKKYIQKLQLTAEYQNLKEEELIDNTISILEELFYLYEQSW